MSLRPLQVIYMVQEGSGISAAIECLKAIPRRVT